ncbi:hypothetical protein [Novosphingobium bradum]|uniref:hypothetical protein n=1 Tax=Novosphingobium bradum TaxID=1737444 RepID=UPI0036D32E41
MPARAVRPDAPATRSEDGGLTGRWAAIHEAAAVVAALAGRAAEPAEPAVRAFPVAIMQAGGQRLAVARQGMDDLSLILETGIRALLAVHAGKASPQAAAEALWAEFRSARDALLALSPPERRLLG